MRDRRPPSGASAPVVSDDGVTPGRRRTSTPGAVGTPAHARGRSTGDSGRRRGRRSMQCRGRADGSTLALPSVPAVVGRPPDPPRRTPANGPPTLSTECRRPGREGRRHRGISGGRYRRVGVPRTAREARWRRSPSTEVPGVPPSPPTTTGARRVRRPSSRPDDRCARRTTGRRPSRRDLRRRRRATRPAPVRGPRAGGPATGVTRRARRRSRTGPRTPAARPRAGAGGRSAATRRATRRRPPR